MRDILCIIAVILAALFFLGPAVTLAGRLDHQEEDRCGVDAARRS